MLAIAILAAGKGSRMQSRIPKVLQQLSGITLIERVLNNCKELKPEKTILIVGHEADQIREKVGYKKDIEFILQQPQNGTGHAVQKLVPILMDFKGDLLVLNGDVPLLRSETIKQLIAKHQSSNAAVTLLSSRILNPKGYGRVFSNNDGVVEKIVEDRDCNSEELTNTLTNAGIYCFNWQKLKEVLPELTDNNNQKEIYLTEAIHKLSNAVHVEVENSLEVKGINDQQQLSECEDLLQEKVRSYWMKKGVRFVNPRTSTIEETCNIGKDVVIESNTHLRGNSIIGDNCILGPNSFIEDSVLANDVFVFSSVIKQSKIGSYVQIGPYANVRPETEVSEHCKLGNFVETKKSRIGKGSKINHLSYIGDTQIGLGVNIGAGTITANFDGISKHKTIIGSYSKTGANSVLVAPIVIGEKVTIGAGSTITKDAPDKSLIIERSKQLVKNNWNHNNPTN